MAVKTVDLGKVVGKSAFEAAVEAGYTGTEAEFYAALVALKDGPFLPLTGGTIRDYSFDSLAHVELDCYGIYFCSDGFGGASITYGFVRNGVQRLTLGDSTGGRVSLGHLATPTVDDEAANKEYVDQTVKPLMRTVTLSASGWSGNAQTVTVDGVLADEAKQRIMPMPASGSQAAYIEAGIRCTGQGANSLIFVCDAIPVSDLTVYVTLEEVRTA